MEAHTATGAAIDVDPSGEAARIYDIYGRNSMFLTARHEYMECRNGKVWPNDRPGLGISVDESQLTFVEEFTSGARADVPPARWIFDSLIGERAVSSQRGSKAGRHFVYSKALFWATLTVGC